MKGEHQQWRPDCLRAAKLLLFVGPPPGLMDAPLYLFLFFLSIINYDDSDDDDDITKNCDDDVDC